MEAPVLVFAGFWKRFAAYLIDSIVITIVAVILVLPFIVVLGVGVALTASMEDPAHALPAIVGAVLAYLFVVILAMVGEWLYFALMESSQHQGTLGKMAVGIKVTDMNGAPVSFGRATGRFFAKFISGLTFGIGYIIAGFTEKKQALHDMIAGCLVVNK